MEQRYLLDAKTNAQLAKHLIFTFLAVVFFLTAVFIGFAGSAYAADMQDMKTGLGKGWIDSTDISCGIVNTDAVTDADTTESSCDATSTTFIALTAMDH